MVLILMGKSATGKDTVLKELVRKHQFIPIISDTTRPKREGEIDGVDYNFLTPEEFSSRKHIEERSYNTAVAGKPAVWQYGCPEGPYSNPSKRYITVFDVNGTNEFISKVGRENCVPIYLYNDEATRKAWAQKRGSFDETEWNRRVQADDRDFDASLITPLAETAYQTNMSPEQLALKIVEYLNAKN